MSDGIGLKLSEAHVKKGWEIASKKTKLEFPDKDFAVDISKTGPTT